MARRGEFLAPGRMGSIRDWNGLINQRTRTTHADAAYWIYPYDSLGQAASGKHF